MRIGKRSVGGIVLGGLGVALGLLMVYTLAFEGAGRRGLRWGGAGRVEVPVFFLERSEWRIFARGVAACTEPARARADDRRG